MLLHLESEWLDDYFSTIRKMEPIPDTRLTTPACYLCEKKFEEVDIRVRGDYIYVIRFT